MKILHVSCLNPKYTIEFGGSIVIENNLKSLRKLYGKDNVESYHLNPPNRNILSKIKIMLLFLFNKPLKAMPYYLFFLEKCLPYDLIFIENSIFGYLPLLIRYHFKTKKIVTMFHNIEIKYPLSGNPFSKWLSLFINFPRLLQFYLFEKMAITHSDLVLFLSQRNQTDAKRFYGKAKRSSVIGVYFEDKFNEDLNVEASKKPINKHNLKLLFVGSDTPHNVAAVKWFVKHVLPFVDATLIIVGLVTKELSYNQNQENIIIAGSAKDISQHYYNADLVVCPLLSGEGMKVKVSEALMYGKTIIGSSEAFSGYDVNIEKIGAICKTPSDYIKAIKHFSATETHRFNLNSRNAFLEKLTAEKYCAKMKTCLNLIVSGTQ